MNSYLISIIINIILLLFVLLISIYSIIITKKLHSKNCELKKSQNYNNILSSSYDNIRSFKHDFTNIVLTIGGFINSNDMVNLKKYYNSLYKECQEINNTTLLNPEIINNTGIYNLLLSKYEKAKEANVKINLECFFDFKKLSMPIYDFSRILGILVDNAIEAAENSDKKHVNIFFRVSYINKTQIIVIENTFDNKKIDLSKIFEKGISSKEKHSGIGLWKVNKVLKQYKNIKLITTAKNGIFKQQLEIYY